MTVPSTHRRRVWIGAVCVVSLALLVAFLRTIEPTERARRDSDRAVPDISEPHAELLVDPSVESMRRSASAIDAGVDDGGRVTSSESRATVAVVPRWWPPSETDPAAVLVVTPTPHDERHAFVLDAVGSWNVPSALVDPPVLARLESTSHVLEGPAWIGTFDSAPTVVDLVRRAALEVRVRGFDEVGPTRLLVAPQPAGTFVDVDDPFVARTITSFATTNGSARFTQLVPGTYVVVAGSAEAEWNSATTLLARETITVGPGDDAVLELRPFSENGARIEGGITRAGVPVAGVEVWIEQPSLRKGADDWKATTAADGRYGLDARRRGVLRVHVDDAGPRRSFFVTVDEAHEVFDVELGNGSVEVVVSPALRGARVRIVPRSLDGARPSEVGSFVLTTDEDGRARADGLPCGTYDVALLAERGVGLLDTAVATIPPDDPSVRVDLSSSASQTVEVVIRDASGAAVSGANVYVRTALRDSTLWAFAGWTDELGRIVARVPSRSGLVVAADVDRHETEGPPRTVDGHVVARIDEVVPSTAVVTCRPAGAVTIGVRDALDGAPILFQVHARSSEGEALFWGSNLPGPSAVVQLERLPPGRTVLVVHDALGRVLTREVDVVAGRNVRIELR